MLSGKCSLGAVMLFFIASTASAGEFNSHKEPQSATKNGLTPSYRQVLRVRKPACFASWYGPGFFGRTMANGKRYDRTVAFVANKSLPFGTKLRITNVKNGLTIVAPVEDRGPYREGREMDLSYEAARQLHAIDEGVIRITYEIVERPASGA